MNLAQIGGEIQKRRVEAGLLQEHVARFAGLSRVTINQLENGTLKELGYTRLKSVMDILGLDIETVQPSGMRSALAVAARSVSTSYKDVLTPDMLAEMLRSGEAPEKFHPHLMALLDETPLSVVVKAVSEAATPEVPAKKIMKNLRLWAKQWYVCRTVW
ncbi:helix-turn-helix transcriptional regulator [Massilia sp. CCM 9210]|uniref:helix-turn-helix domain-containing protein n=1 Tax=Massilia scottii TaxID=3057166 RepID=UPI0027965C2E|nr:helix-turn-helix transcriptional regulator [Massilia sp. CCM 9210]MDQ1812009.1 helix-turn-helix transcriptional regulator [Massilia sp. CCM 9210]